MLTKNILLFGDVVTHCSNTDIPIMTKNITDSSTLHQCISTWETEEEDREALFYNIFINAQRASQEPDCEGGQGVGAEKKKGAGGVQEAGEARTGGTIPKVAGTRRN